MKKNILPLLAVLCACSAVSCASEKTEPAPPPVFSFKTLSPDYKAKVKRGGTFVFELEENMTTGYSWTASADPKLAEVRLEHLPASSDLIGAPGRARVSVRPLTSSPAVVTLLYIRPWEKNKAEPAHRMVCTVTPE